MKEKLFFTKEIKFSQQLFLLLTGLLIFTDLLFLTFNFSFNMLLVFSIHFFLTVFVNYIFNRIYSIKVENGVITIENMWRKTTCPLSDLIDIDLVRFVLPYPFNPFLKFELKSKTKVIAVLPNRIRIYLSDGGMSSYIANLKNQLIYGR